MKNTTVAEQVSLMITMLSDEYKKYIPLDAGGHVNTDRKVCEGKLQVLRVVHDLLTEGSQEERNRHKEIWTHFLTILDTRREEMKDVEYDYESMPFPEDTLTDLEKDYLLYLRSHGLDAVMPIGGGE